MRDASSFLFWEVNIIITIYYYTFYQFECIATPNMWNGIEIVFWSKKWLALFLTGTSHPSATKYVE